MEFSDMADRMVWPPSLSSDWKWPRVGLVKCTHSRVVSLRLEGNIVLYYFYVVFCIIFIMFSVAVQYCKRRNTNVIHVLWFCDCDWAFSKSNTILRRLCAPATNEIIQNEFSYSNDKSSRLDHSSMALLTWQRVILHYGVIVSNHDCGEDDDYYL